MQLPTRFEGGTIWAEQGDHYKEFPWAARSGFGAFFTAFYSDVQHAIEPITGGHRLALIFNLIYTGGGPQPSFEHYDPPKSFIRHFRNWARDPRAPDFLVHVCAHEYTEHSLDFDHLKVSGPD